MQAHSSTRLRFVIAVATLAGQSACLVEFPERGPDRDEDNVFIYDGADALSGAAPGAIPPEGPPATPPDPEGVAPPGGPPTKPPPDAPEPDVPEPAVPDAVPPPAPDPGGCVEGLCARCDGGARVVPVEEPDCSELDCSAFPAIESGVDAQGVPYCHIRPTRIIGHCREFAVCAVAGPRTCAPDPDPATVISVVAPSACYEIDGCEPGGNPVPRPVAGLACPGGTCDGNGVCVASPAGPNCQDVDAPEGGEVCGAGEQPVDACRFLVRPTASQNQVQHWDDGNDDGNPQRWPAIHCGNYCRSMGLTCVRVLENVGGNCSVLGVCVNVLDRAENSCCELTFFENNGLDALDVRDGGLCDCR